MEGEGKRPEYRVTSVQPRNQVHCILPTVSWKRSIEVEFEHGGLGYMLRQGAPDIGSSQAKKPQSLRAQETLGC